MRLFVKLFGLVLLICTISMVGAISQRITNGTSKAGSLLFASTDCGSDCWFGIPVDGAMRHPEIQANLTSAGATDMRFSGSFMRFRMLNENRTSNHIQVQLNETGYAEQLCFFPANLTISDMIIEFGNPDYFFFDRSTLRQFYDQTNYQLEAYRIRFNMIYTDEKIVASGVVQINIENPQSHLPFDMPLMDMCVPGYQSASGIRSLPNWEGFFRAPEFYYSYSPTGLLSANSNFQ